MTNRADPSVISGLLEDPKNLPTWLLYDDVGSELYRQITGLPEYYLTRAEAEILEHQGDEIARRASAGASELSTVELGAGSSEKTELFLRAMVRQRGGCVHLACDIEAAALESGAARLKASLPSLDVRTFVGTHQAAGVEIAKLPGRQVVLFIGSSIGNFPDEEAIRLLQGLRRHLREDAFLVLGTDLEKPLARLLPAYDDSAGVTAAFTLNVLARLNRELGARFDIEAFRHVALWNEVSHNIEIFIESRKHQQVFVGAGHREIEFAAGERVLLEISAKYDLARVDSLLGPAGFRRAESYFDAASDFAVHLARCVV